MDYGNIQVIDVATLDIRAQIKELLHILHPKPKPKKQLYSQSKYEIKTLIL